MKFIKENSYDIVKFFIYQIGIAVFSLTLAIPLAAAVDDKNDGIVQLFVSILAVLFYCMLVYTVSWDHGATERIRIDAGKSTLDKYRGAKIALLACVPNAILASVAIVASLLYAEGNAWNSVLGLLLAILGLIEAMYLGAIQFISSAIANEENVYLINSIGYLIFPLIIVVASHLGYIFGDKNFRLFGFIPSKNNKKTKK
jgi:MFS family permease